jgi:hypothetical protein
MRCAICHDSLGTERSTCSSCRSAAHTDCRASLARCPTLGCIASIEGRLRAPTVAVLPEGNPSSCLLPFLLAAAITTAVLVFGCWYVRVEAPRQWRTQLITQVRAAEPVLLAHVRDIRSGKLKPGTTPYDHGRYELPMIPAGGPSIEYVIMDESGNVIFNTEHSLEWNAGFEHRNGSAPVTGTNPRRSYVEHLFDDWWLYRDSGP